jgi:hypothetical protein
MGKQCQRPDCSEQASVAYQFDAKARVVVLDQLAGSLDPSTGALCVRHAATMILPRGWWLDDRRQAVPSLFASLRRDLEETPTRKRRTVRGSIVAPRTNVGSPDAGVAATMLAASQVRSTVPRAKAVEQWPTRPAAPAPPEPTAAPSLASEDDEAERARRAETHQHSDHQQHREAMTPAAEVDPEVPTVLWTPDFDDTDDLSGLLLAESPLLARAFTGVDRARRRKRS